jgi:predicted nucleic acid-binding protein
MIAVDTSVVVAAFASWHTMHGQAAEVLAAHPAVPGQVLAESYSVLTRLPPPHRAPPSLVTEFLAERFPQPPLVLPADRLREIVLGLSTRGVLGGAVYDALIGGTAGHAGLTLATCDSRAIPVYERVGCEIRLLS